MESNETITQEDEGKNVVNSNGDQIGRVVNVEHGKAHVDPDPGLTDTVRSKMGWGDDDEEDYQLDASSVDTVSDSEIHLDR